MSLRNLYNQNPNPHPPFNSQPILIKEHMRDVDKSLRKIDSVSELKITYFGSTDFSAYILERLVEFCQNSEDSLFTNNPKVQYTKQRFLLQTIITQPDRPVGRKLIMTPTKVSQVANKYKIPALKPEKLDTEFITNHFSLLDSDISIVAAYGKILPKELLNIPALGVLNIHGSILPKYRGASPIQNAILNGDNKTGVTIILMDEKMDHGPILSIQELKVSKKDTFESLSNKLALTASKLLMPTLLKFVNYQITPKPQNHKQATFCKLIKKEDGYFDIQSPPPPEYLNRMIRAYYPWPNVWTKWRNKIVKLLPNKLIQMEGKKAVYMEEFFRGYPDFPKTLLG